MRVCSSKKRYNNPLDDVLKGKLMIPTSCSCVAPPVGQALKLYLALFTQVFLLCILNTLFSLFGIIERLEKVKGEFVRHVSYSKVAHKIMKFA